MASDPSVEGSTLLQRIEGFLNTRLGNAFLILAWPLLVAGLGLPTSAAQDCPPCP